MKTCLKILATLAIASSAATALPARAAWPERPVTVVVPFPPGGPTDLVARVLAKQLADQTGQSFVVENKGGANGNIGMQYAASAKPDGYTVLYNTSSIALSPNLYRNLPFDPVKDFAAVSSTAVIPLVLLTHPSVPVSNVREFVDYARAHPGKLSYGSAGAGNVTHLGALLFLRSAGVEAVHVPYRGSAPAMQDLLGGQVQMMFADGPSAMPHLSGGKIRPLGVGNPEPSALFPGIPTIAASGVPGYEAYSWSGVLAPAGTPADTIKRVNADMARVLADPATVKGMLAAGAEPRPGTPEQFGAFLQAELDKWSKVIKQAGIKVE